MSKSKIDILDVVRKAREYDKTKSVTTATEVCKMIIAWAYGIDEDDEKRSEK